MKYLVYLAQAHPEFRVAELQSLADLNNIDIEGLENHKLDTPYLIIDIKNGTDTLAKKLIKRAMLARGIYELYANDDTVIEDYDSNNNENLHNKIKIPSCLSRLEEHAEKTFKFDFETFQGSRDYKSQMQFINQFQYVPLRGKISLKKPQEQFIIFEHFNDTSTSQGIKQVLLHRYFTRKIASSARDSGVLDQYDLKKRKYVGTTSFDAELSLVSVNIAQVDFGKIMYDPFVGTGSFLVTGAQFGALTFGSDIDFKPLLGKTTKKNIPLNIKTNFKQYNTEINYLDVLNMDFTHSCLRKDFKIDTIVCDPPYGVREGLKVLGTDRVEHFKGKENVEIDGVKAYLRKEYVPTKRNYQLASILDDLLNFAYQSLEINGRLVFWMPVANDEDYKDARVPSHFGLELKYNCIQKFNKWSRRLLCYIKRDIDYNGETIKAGDILKNEFRDRYFSGFNKLSLGEN